MAAILIVEPQSQLRDDLESALRAAGHRVLIATDGDEALSAWRAERHELAIVDESAARVNGAALAARVKSETTLGFMPVIIVTARNDAALRAQLLSAADDVIARPYSIVELVARVTTLLRTRAIVDELRVSRAESEARTYADAVTGLRNRAFLGERLLEEFKRSVRYNEPLSLLLLGIDHFRTLVDQYGAQMGERLLQAVSAAALRSLRQIDVITRYGPSEIAALLPNTHVAGALICADRLRRESALSAVDGRPTSIAMGLAFYPGKDVSEPTDLMRTAARALDRAREEGPGSICLVQHQGYLFQPK
jgi:two-component system cell cycle response regulator